MMKKLYLVHVEIVGTSTRTGYRVSAENHTAARRIVEGIGQRRGTALQIVGIHEVDQPTRRPDETRSELLRAGARG